MAVLRDSPTGTAVAPSLTPLRRGTSPDVDPAEQGGRPHKPPRPVTPSNGNRTGEVVSEEEGGDEHGDEMRADSCSTDASSLTGLLSGDLPEKRQEVAERLVALMERVIKSHLNVSMAANLQVVKRELSRCHDVLGSSRHESDYLSIITLVEANLACMDWKSATRRQLEQIKQSLAVGCEERHVTFDHYSRAVRRLRRFGLPTMPTFEVGTEEED